jgi:hypothetical protein
MVIGKSPQYGGFSGNNIEHWEMMEMSGKNHGKSSLPSYFRRFFFVDPGRSWIFSNMARLSQHLATNQCHFGGSSQRLQLNCWMFFPHDVSSEITRQVCCTYFCHCDHCSDVVKLTEGWTEGWNLTKK